MDTPNNQTTRVQAPAHPSAGAALNGCHHYISDDLAGDALASKTKAFGQGIRTVKQPFKLSIALAITLSTALLTLADANESTIHTKAYFGGRTIDSDAWRAQAGHGSIGFITDFRTGLNGVRVAFDLIGSGSEEETSSPVKGTYTAEAHLGLRQYFDLSSRIQSYIGGGVNFAYATQENNDGAGNTAEEDMDTGFWLNGGVDFSVTDQISAGIDVRYAAAEVALYDESVELNALATGVSLGYRW